MMNSFHLSVPVFEAHGVFGDACLPSVDIIVLRAVEADLLVAAGDAHRDDSVGDPIEEVAHDKGVGKDHQEHKDMIEEERGMGDHVGVAFGEEVVGEDSRQDGSDYASESVGREYVERIVEHMSVALPAAGKVAADGDDEGDADALSDGDPSGARGYGNESHHGTDGCAHG